MKKLKKIVLAFCIFMSSFLVFLVPFGAKTEALDSKFGVNAFVINRYGWREWDSPINSMKELGVGWSREEFIWELIEPEKGDFQWSFYDQATGALSSSKVNILGVLDYSAPWATEDPNRANADKYMPNIDDWKNYVTKVVTRYSGRVKYWQIWNEPNITTFFRPAPNANQYLEILKSAYEAIKKIDPSAQVVIAGTSGVDVGYLRQLRDLAAGDYFDILAVHPYSFDFVSPPEGNFLNNMRNAQKLSEEFGGKPIWLTEFGWPTNSNEVASENIQAKYLSRVYLMSYQFPNVKKLFWYDLRNDGDDKNDRENNFGLINRDYTKKKAYYAYKNLINILNGSQFEKADINEKNGTYDFSFIKGNSRIRAIWRTNGSDNINLGSNLSNIKILDFVGNDITPKNQNGPVLVNISDFPTFIISNNVEISNIDYGQSFEYEYIDQSPNITINSGEEKELWLKIRNTGTAVWKNNGSNPMMLGTYRSMDRASSFFNNGVWFGSNRPAKMKEDVVRKGEIATFIFKIKANQVSNGIYREYFCPLTEGFTWMNDIGIYWDISVGGVNSVNQLSEPVYDPKLTYHAVYISQTDSWGNAGGYSEQVELKIKNTGTATWYNYGAHPIRLGTSNPLDRTNSVLKVHPSSDVWISDNRPTTMKETEVKPGEVATFLFTITRPTQKGMYKEYFRPVVEGVKWMEDFGLYWQIIIN